MTTSTQLPVLSHLQSLVLQTVNSTARTGHEIRQELAKHGVGLSRHTFYLMMARLERAGFVRGSAVWNEAYGYRLKDRQYGIRGNGRERLDETKAFYREFSTSGGSKDAPSPLN